MPDNEEYPWHSVALHMQTRALYKLRYNPLCTVNTDQDTANEMISSLYEGSGAGVGEGIVDLRAQCTAGKDSTCKQTKQNHRKHTTMPHTGNMTQY